MAALPLATHQTPLDALRILLAGYESAPDEFPSQLLQAIQQLGHFCLRVLGPALKDPKRPKGLRRAIYQAALKVDAPWWITPFRDGLLYEPDLGVFDEGCASLGNLGMRAALDALQTLADTRLESSWQTILQRERSLYKTQQSVEHYLSRMQEGKSNLRLAYQGAKLLSVAAGIEHLPAILEAYQQGDPLTQRLALRVMASLEATQGPQALLNLLNKLRAEYADGLLLQHQLRRTSSLPRSAVRADFLQLVVERFGAHLPHAVARLAAIEPGDTHVSAVVLDPLRRDDAGPYDRFLLESLGLLLESKVARYQAFHAETTDALEQRFTRIHEHVEVIAELLLFLTEENRLQDGDVLPSLRAAFDDGLGGDGLLRVYLQLLPPQDQESLHKISNIPSPERRQKCMLALGAREEDALTPFFLDAMQDAIVEVGQLAIHQLGKLPSSFNALMEMFRSDQLDHVRRAIRVFGENRTRDAADPLLAFIQTDIRDDVLLEAVEALGAIRHPPAVPALLELLHDGKPLNLQLALAQALSNVGKPEASLGLLERASNLKQPAVLILALEGALSAFPDFQHPFPSELLPKFEALFDRCCDDREGEGRRLRAMMLCEQLFVFDKNVYLHLKDRFSDVLSDLRLQPNWDRDNNERVAALAKEMGRRGDVLGRLSRFESDIRGRIQHIPGAGPMRVEELLALREALSAPEVLLRPEFAAEIGQFVLTELGKPSGEWRDVAHLCEIGGISGIRELVDPIRDIFQRATGLGLRSAAQQALLRLGLTPAECAQRPPVQSVLVLEPSAFFRKRLVSILEKPQLWTIHEAGSRQEAAAILTNAPVDVIVTESQDAEGPLDAWIDKTWRERGCRGVVLSSAIRAAEGTWEGPKMLGLLYKPYAPEALLDILNP